MTNAEKYLIKSHDIGKFVQKLVKEISYFDGRKYYSDNMETATLTFFSEEADND